MSSLTTIPTTPPASSPTATRTMASLSIYYTPASGYSHSSISVSTTASEGPSNVPGNSIAASRAAASASSAAAAAAASGSAKSSSSGSSLGLALGLGLGLGILLLLGLLGAMYIIRQRRIQRLAFAGRASRIQQTMRTVNERQQQQQSPNVDTTESPLYS